LIKTLPGILLARSHLENSFPLCSFIKELISLQVGFGLTHAVLHIDTSMTSVVLVLKNSECKNCGVIEASSEISKKILRDQEMFGHIKVPASYSYKGCESDPKLQWRPWDIRLVSNPHSATVCSGCLNLNYRI
jgi:hypothetical protein